MFKLLFLLFPLFLNYIAFSQSYTTYFTGNSTDVVTSPFGGVCIMGGATEHDEAMKWFLEQANGGDILVLRTSGSNGYNNYLYSQLGIGVNSVETIVFNNATASNDAYVLQQIQNAEAIWFAGGDQWNYVSYWRNTPIDSLINLALVNKKIVIGGTSAGMAIQGGYYFSAENGTVTSATALNNPYDFDVTVDSTKFLDNDYLGDVITDTHYDNPDRKGRHITFLARIFMDYGVQAKGIACQEYTAVCIDTN
jgi:cyanophycinase-like exopeptidase